MTIRDLVKAYLLADDAVSGYLGTRLYADGLPQKVTYPAGKIFIVSLVRDSLLTGAAPHAKARIQCDVWASPTSGPGSRGIADVIGKAIRLRLAGKNVTLTDATTSPSIDVFVQIGDPLEREGADTEIGGGLSDWSSDFPVSYETHGGLY